MTTTSHPYLACILDALFLGWVSRCSPSQVIHRRSGKAHAEELVDAIVKAEALVRSVSEADLGSWVSLIVLN